MNTYGIPTNSTAERAMRECIIRLKIILAAAAGLRLSDGLLSPKLLSSSEAARGEDLLIGQAQPAQVGHRKVER